MVRIILLTFLFFSLPLYAYETVAITHVKVFPRTTTIDGNWGSLEIVGNIDRVVDGRGTFSLVQYRMGEGPWVTISSLRSNHVWDVSASLNFRRYEFGPVKNVSFELRVCPANETCSLPFVVHLTPLFDKVLLPASGVITPMNKTLTFRIANHQIGGMKFQIGKMVTWPGSSDIDYTPLLEVAPSGPCPKPGGSRECDIIIPDAIIKAPGTYHLTATSLWGQSINYLKFETSSVFKILGHLPERIRFHVQDVLTFNFAGGIMRPNDIEVSMTAPCRLRRIPLNISGEQVFIKIPHRCMPTSGFGNLELEVHSPEGVQQVKVPYEI